MELVCVEQGRIHGGKTKRGGGDGGARPATLLQILFAGEIVFKCCFDVNFIYVE